MDIATYFADGIASAITILIEGFFLNVFTTILELFFGTGATLG